MEFLKKVHWLGHASVRIDASKTIYIDPWKVAGGPKADLILVTHDHFDHLSPADIAKIEKPGTVIVGPPSVKGKVKGDFQEITAGKEIHVGGVRIHAIAAYNIGKDFHPRQARNVGYFVTVDTVTLYHAGDTDHIPEMKGLKPDIAMLPIGGTYTMDVPQAIRAVQALEPRVVVPIHYGDIVGTADDALKLKKICTVPVEILANENPGPGAEPEGGKGEPKEAAKK